MRVRETRVLRVAALPVAALNVAMILGVDKAINGSQSLLAAFLSLFS